MNGYVNQIDVPGLFLERQLTNKIHAGLSRFRSWVVKRLCCVLERLRSDAEAVGDSRARMLGRAVTEARMRLAEKSLQIRQLKRMLEECREACRKDVDYVLSECEQLEYQRDAAYKERDQARADYEKLREGAQCSMDRIELPGEEVFPGEMREHILEALEDVLKRMDDFRARRKEVLRAVIRRNLKTGVLADRRQEVESIFRGKNSLSGCDIKRLERIGVKLDSDKNHYKFRIGGVMVTMSKTPGDWRVGNKRISEMNNKCF